MIWTTLLHDCKESLKNMRMLINKSISIHLELRHIGNIFLYYTSAKTPKHILFKRLVRFLKCFFFLLLTKAAFFVIQNAAKK